MSLVGLVTDSDNGSQGQFTSVRYVQRVEEFGAQRSIGSIAIPTTVRISALAEPTNGLYKTECVYGPDTNGWDDDLEFTTLS